MSSFYGNGGGGTIDYNKLKNRPVTNLTGTEESPVILNTLDYGEYIINGNYLYTLNDSVLKGGDEPLYVLMFKDTVTSKKIAKYEIFEDEVYYINNIYFGDEETYLIDKFPIKGNGGILFIEDDSDLPIIGEEGLLYIKEADLYKWVNDNVNDYIRLGVPRWNSISSSGGPVGRSVNINPTVTQDNTGLYTGNVLNQDNISTGEGTYESDTTTSSVINMEITSGSSIS